MPAQPKQANTSKPEPVSSPNDVLAALRTAISTASAEERNALASELGVTQAVAPPPSMSTRRRQTTEDVQTMSRGSGGCSHPGQSEMMQKGPAPPQWVVDLGGGMNTEEEDIDVYNQKTGRIEEITETTPIPGDAAYHGNWAVEIYRDRWFRQLPPLPSAEAYHAERANSGSFGSGPDPELLAAQASE